MDLSSIPETSYPLSFRQEISEKLGTNLSHRQNVNIIGMRRVGISHFLRFFLYHQDIIPTYVSWEQKHLFIPVDLNNLVEREIYPFWTLTLKRLVDACSESLLLPQGVKDTISKLFSTSVQLSDLFLVIDTIRSILLLCVKEQVYPSFFFIRFDRLQNAFNASLFDNLEGLYQETHEQLSYVFTSSRSLDSLFPTAKTSLSLFAQQLFITPATRQDMSLVYQKARTRSAITLSNVMEEELFRLVNGNIQYLQLAHIILRDKHYKIKTTKELFDLLVTDERIILESEELWESLQKEEQKVLLRLTKKQAITPKEKRSAAYLWNVGFIIEKNGENSIFSPLLEYYVLHKEPEETKSSSVHLTRKEHLLFTLLEEHLGEICERDEIVTTVWPEYQEFGVSDWAIDRLVARVRVKLRQQNSPFEIVTVRTRGYKLSKIKE